MNTRPPPPTGAPPLVGRVYRRNLRPIVMITSALAALWAVYLAYNFFRGITQLSPLHVPTLVTFSIVLGIMYLLVFGFEVFGFVAASTQRTPFIRIYSYLSAAICAIILVAGVLRLVVHFTQKNDIIGACTTLSQGNQTTFGSWGAVTSNVTPQQANHLCSDDWSKGIWMEIGALILTLLLAGLFCAVAFSYLRQALDPMSAANVQRLGGRVDPYYPAHYNPPYNGPGNYGYNGPYDGGAYQGSFAPPPGPPPLGHEPGKLPDYPGGDGAAAYGDNKNPFADFEGASHAPPPHGPPPH